MTTSDDLAKRTVRRLNFPNVPKIDSARIETADYIETQRDVFENMVRRCRAAKEVPDQVVIDDFSEGSRLCLQQTTNASNEEKFQQLRFQAEQLAQQRAYICPLTEVYDEGSHALESLKDWGV